MKRSEKRAEELFGNKEEKSMGAVEAAAEGVKIGVGTFIGAILDAAYSKDMKEFVAHGAHELASGLVNGVNGGTGFVMYPRTGKDLDGTEAPDHGLGNKGLENKGQDQPGHTQERGGMEL